MKTKQLLPQSQSLHFWDLVTSWGWWLLKMDSAEENIPIILESSVGQSWSRERVVLRRLCVDRPWGPPSSWWSPRVVAHRAPPWISLSWIVGIKIANIYSVDHMPETILSIVHTLSYLNLRWRLRSKCHSQDPDSTEGSDLPKVMETTYLGVQGESWAVWGQRSCI